LTGSRFPSYSLKRCKIFSSGISKININYYERIKYISLKIKNIFVISDEKYEQILKDMMVELI